MTETATDWGNSMFFDSPLLDRAEWGQAGRHDGSNRAPGQQISVNAPHQHLQTSPTQSWMFAVMDRTFEMNIFFICNLIRNFFFFCGHGDNQNNSKNTFTHASSSYVWFYGIKRFTVLLTDCFDMYALSVHVNESVWIWKYHLAHHINRQLQQAQSVTRIPGIQHSQEIGYIISAVLRPIHTEILLTNY